MKQVKFLMVALIVLMGTMVTSCMNSDPDPMVSGTTFMRVKSGGIFGNYVFEAGENLTFTATNVIKDFEASAGHIAIVSWRYDSSLQPVDQNTKNVNVEVLGAQDVTSDFRFVTEGVGDVESNVSILTLEPNDMKPMYYDKNNLILPIGYYAEKDATKHDFTLVYISDEELKSDQTGKLRFHLRHESSEDLTKEAQRALSYCAFDIRSALADYQEKNAGQNPTEIVIVVQENSSNKLPEAGKPGADKEYVLDYKFKD